MGLGDFIKGQFIDVIEFVEPGNKLLVYKYTREGDEIKNGAHLIVRNGQVGVFVCRGSIADIFMPGNYRLTTQNLPLLSSFSAIPMLLNSPIKSDLYFLNTTQFLNNKWGTKNPILLRDKDMNMVRVRAFGTYSFRINEPTTFMNEVFGARQLNLTYDIIQFLNSFVSEAVAQSLGECGVPVLDMAVKYRNMSENICELVNQKANKLGIEIPELAIENISLPNEVEKLIDEQSGISMAAKNMDTFMQYQTARAMRDASKQEGGLAGLGAGFAFGNQMVNQISKTTSPKEKSNVEKLREYKELLNEGLITEAEFSELKKKLLGI
mgnify:CR=1 FL=1|nr:SPFH domain-containing protein [uncultured Anaerotignum sp.]